MANRVKTVLEMIKFEHSVFALPFALTGALLAARATHQPPRGWPSLRQILWIVVAMVAARSAAMTMNRIADLRYDRENPRTKQRALPTGALTLQFAWFFTLVAVVAFFRRGVAIESPCPEAGATGDRHSFFLFLHETVYQLVSSFSWICAGHLARSRMDRHHGRPRPAHAHPLRGGYAVGGGV